MEKTLEKFFAEWHSEVFGFGYGSGEPYTLAAVKGFMANVGREGYPNMYNYEVLEKALTPTVAWLLINTFCKHGIDLIEYGTSPRFGWLTPEGVALKAFVDGKTVEELETICEDEELDHCARDFCNCGPQGYTPKKLCFNPFWVNKQPTPANQ